MNVLSMAWPRLVGITAVAILASFTIEPALGALLPVSPAIPMAAVCVIAALNGPLHGVVAGGVAGIILDFFGAGALGVQMGALALEGYVIGRAVRYMPLGPAVIRVALVSPLMMIAHPAIWALSLVAGDRFSLGGYRAALGLIAVNLLCAVIITPFISAASARTRTD
jgi:rod shape-determining protein MreD